MGRARTFDYDEARRRHAAGESYASLGREFGVSQQAVTRACDDGVRTRMDRASAEWIRSGRCPDCGRPATRHGLQKQLRCRTCAAHLKTTSVRDSELQCVVCREWKPDDEFPRSVAEPQRRSRHTNCRACCTVQRREYRQRNPEKERAYQRAYKRKRRAEQKAA